MRLHRLLVLVLLCLPASKAPSGPRAAHGTAPLPDRVAAAAVPESPAGEVRVSTPAYFAAIGSHGLRFESRGTACVVALDRIEQGGAMRVAEAGGIRRDGASTRIDRGGGVTEEFLLDAERVEHLVHLREPIGEGAIVCRVDLTVALDGPVTEVRRGSPGWSDPRLADGGLRFRDLAETRELFYHGAVAVDAAGRRRALDIRYDAGQAVIEVPAGFVSTASFPLTIDPWIEVGGSATGGGVSNTGGASRDPQVAVDALGRITVAWKDSTSGSSQIYVRRWNGSAWEELGGSASGGGISGLTDGTVDSPTLIVGTDGEPIVAYDADDPSDYNYRYIYVKRWTGTAWISMGVLGIGMSTAQFPWLAIGANGHIAISWTQLVVGYYATTNEEVFAARWNGSGWSDMGGSATYSPLLPSGGVSRTTGISLDSFVAVDGAGNPTVAWTETVGTSFQIYVKRFNGAVWQELDGSASGDGLSNALVSVGTPSIGVDTAGNPVVAYEDGPIVVKRWTGSAWESMPSLDCERPSLRMDGDTPCMAVKIQYAIHFVRWDGTAWAFLEPDPAGINGPLSVSSDVSLALDGAGYPVIAWTDAFPDTLNPEIRLKRYAP